ncbi:hypothetical protein DL95DRAFT_519273 [Leptodontidium sp. 2 PMI_412]|nr:hypothetical protein DL95DRAFT_519273 [Leptodontidium sp. 2 PMI_412]
MAGDTTLKFPAGAEYDALSDEDRERIFEDPVKPSGLTDGSLAEQYIARRLSTNPLRSLDTDMEDAVYVAHLCPSGRRKLQAAVYRDMASSNGLTASTDLNLNDLYEKLRELELMDSAVISQLMENFDIEMTGNGDIHRPLDDLGLIWGMTAKHNKTLHSLKSLVDDFRGLIRKNIDILSRPSVRPFSILDLPDEILVKICGYVKGWEPDPNTSLFHSQYTIGTKEVQNLRLSCKRLCGASSHLLLHFIKVDFTAPASIRRLQEISLHPAISKGVATVRVIMSFYDSKLAGSFLLFARYNAEILAESADGVEKMARHDEAMAKYEDEGLIPKDHRSRAQRIEDKKKDEDDVKRGRLIADSWNRMQTSDESLSGEGEPYQNALRRGHEEYRKLFEEQEILLKDGSFNDSVAAAMARMPLATRLEIHDYGFDIRYFDNHVSRWVANDKSLVRGSLVPMSWSEAIKHDLGYPPTEIAITLPVAIHKAGVSLASLDIQSLLPEDYFTLAPSDKELKELTDAMQKLKTFRFTPVQARDEGHWRYRQSTELKCLQRLISAILDSPSIETISLELRQFWPDETFLDPNLLSLPNLLNLRSWPRLSCVSLRSAPLSLEDLAKIVNLGTKPIRFSGDDLHLQDGSWADGLDLLRKETAGDGFFGRPTGAECDNMSEDELDAIFKPSEASWPFNKADLYIRGKIVKNPLRDDETGHEDGVVA